MAARQHLQHAPIIEALIDFRVEPRPDLRVAEIKALHDVLGKDAFPVLLEQARLSGTLQLADEPSLTVNPKEPVGCLFRGADELHVLQAQLEGFAISRLPPYDNWESLIGQARIRWAQYAGAVRPRRITRVAVRYINRIELPLPLVDFREWLPTFTDIPAGLPQSIAEMFLRVVVPVPEVPAAAIITLGMEPGKEGDLHARIIFDIDVFRLGDFPVDGEDVWTALDLLRDVKNRFFFEYLSDKAIELFK